MFKLRKFLGNRGIDVDFPSDLGTTVANQVQDNFCILELGAGYGYPVICLLRRKTKIDLYDPNLDKSILTYLKKRFPRQITYLKSRPEASSGKTYDMAYIDLQGDPADMVRFLTTAILLVRPGGIIVVNNVIRSKKAWIRESTKSSTIAVQQAIQTGSVDDILASEISPGTGFVVLQTV